MYNDQQFLVNKYINYNSDLYHILYVNYVLCMPSASSHTYNVHTCLFFRQYCLYVHQTKF